VARALPIEIGLAVVGAPLVQPAVADTAEVTVDAVGRIAASRRDHQRERCAHHDHNAANNPRHEIPVPLPAAFGLRRPNAGRAALGRLLIRWLFIVQKDRDEGAVDRDRLRATIADVPELLEFDQEEVDP
jgi:hypothetical protein